MIYLYVKRHTVTGLKYFGKTVRKNPIKYKGSGTRWLSHIKKHGNQHVVTDEVWSFEDQDECTRFALQFSMEHNIIESNEWANLVLEDGLTGGAIKYTPEQRQAIYEERKKKQLAYYYANREKRLAYHQANKERNNKRQQDWYMKQPKERVRTPKERSRLYFKNYYNRKKEKLHLLEVGNNVVV